MPNRTTEPVMQVQDGYWSPVSSAVVQTQDLNITCTQSRSSCISALLFPPILFQMLPWVGYTAHPLDFHLSHLLYCFGNALPSSVFFFNLALVSAQSISSSLYCYIFNHRKVLQILNHPPQIRPKVHHESLADFSCQSLFPTINSVSLEEQ